MALFTCPHCSWRVKFTEHELGKRDKCIQCGQAIIFPSTLAAKVEELPPAPTRPHVKKSSRFAARRWLALSASVIVLAVVGVLIILPSRPGRQRTDVFGRVTYNSKPLIGGAVSFIGENGSLRATISKDGSYLLEKCPAGSVKATVRHHSTTLEKQQGDKIHWVAKSLIPTRYENPKTSGLEFSISGDRQESNIDLKD
ncbi:MAG: hypothetical protein FJ271_17375 [Planctomycetes bacterium]|nr:hypothetical protein [Planctomycetota bacterium]